LSNPEELFFTRKIANQGTRIALVRPDTGEESEHAIWIHGVDSDAYRKAGTQQQRDWMQLIATEGEKARDKIGTEEDKLKITASLVFKWTFEKPCTTQNVVDFLREAPQIADAIDTLASRRTLFFRQALKDSTPLPESNSS
jgi:hypothetical protein